jgi:hypothetical protein
MSVERGAPTVSTVGREVTVRATETRRDPVVDDGWVSAGTSAAAEWQIEAACAERLRAGAREARRRARVGEVNGGGDRSRTGE